MVDDDGYSIERVHANEEAPTVKLHNGSIGLSLSTANYHTEQLVCLGANWRTGEQQMN
jgi:hypothetical protein